MNPFDETPPLNDKRPEQNREPENSPAGDALLAAAETGVMPETVSALPVAVKKPVPEDLEISWSWPHFIIFLVFAFISILLIQTVLAFYLAPRHSMPQKELEKYLLTNPKFALGSMVIWYAVLFFFLYVTLAVLRGHAFWRVLGWRKIQPKAGELPRNPLVYFLAGCGLSLFVAVVSSQMKTPENVPIEEWFKHRETALLFVAMAVIVAPLVEETLFRGYFYPLLARSFGMAPGIIITGLCFGVMHGAQLGWTWSLVSMLILVGIVLTLVRARTGSVLASYLMHLGYNSLISFFAIVGTHGFTKTN